MTRASLLRILDHADGISDGEIRELEQLAAAFPYCQMAHVLLAKAAHDRGSMLAGQRLRRAATYATDRELLRQLLERPATAPTAAVTPAAPTTETPASNVAPAGAAATAEVVPAGLAASTDAPVSAELAAISETGLFAVEAVSVTVLADETSPMLSAAPATSAVPAVLEVLESARVVAAVAASEEAVATPALPVKPPAAEPQTTTATPVAASTVTSTDDIQFATLEQVADSEEALTTTSLTTETEEAPEAQATTATAQITKVSDEAAGEIAATKTANEAAAPADAVAADELLPAAAPPIRPPSGAGISRFEFGLGESRLPESTGYRLPGIGEEDENFDPEEAELPTLRPKAPPRITAPFRADAELGYALGGGSRLGYDLQARTPHGFALDLPLEAFFEPDALLLAHARAHQPAPKTSSLDLIDRFLKAQPRIKSGTVGAPLPATEQADLSVRSNAAAPALASESLAKIMVRQGKTAKAIEIYERLMAKQPEKMAYFAQQIQQLQQPPE